MGYDPSTCNQKLKQKNLQPACEQLPDPLHCNSIVESPSYHSACHDEDLYFPVAVLVCHNPKTNEYRYFPPSTFFKDCNALHSQDPNWEGGTCYCCCSCFANDTLIAVPSGVTPIYAIAKGDAIVAGSAQGTSLTWREVEVNFSQGTGAGGHQPLMVYFAFEDGTDLICTPDQPLLRSDGKYIVAQRVAPGMSLVKRDGSPLPVKLASIGSYTGGVHHIATKVPWKGKPDGHLIVAGGVVAGDYTMQLHFGELPAEAKVADHDELPALGTAAYAEHHGSGIKSHDVLFEFHVGDGAADAAGPAVRRNFAHGKMQTYSREDDAVPFGAQPLLTEAQAASVLANGTFVPLSNTIGHALFNTVARQFAGFFPDIDFYYAPLAMLPQVYAFEAYGRKIVQVNGGLTRLKDFNYEGLAMAMAHGVGCFEGGAPTNTQGFSAVGQADLFAFGGVSRKVWVSTPFLTYLEAAMQQWKTLFDLVSQDSAQGNPSDPLDDPGLACRWQNIQSAAAGGGLSACAGGPPLPKLALEQASPDGDSKVELTFSVGVDPIVGNEPANYVLSNGATVTKATVNARTNFVVELETSQLEAGTQYEVTVKNLTSYLGGDLDPKAATTTFTTPSA